MKNTVRVHCNGGKKSRPSQAQSPARTQVKPVPKSICLVFFDLDAGGSVGNGIEFSSDEFAAIQKDAAKASESLDAWLQRQLTEIIKKIAPEVAS